MTSAGRSLQLQLDPARTGAFDGAVWPSNRDLEDQLTQLFALWPATEPGIARVLYSRPDWGTQQTATRVGTRRVKTGSFPRDDTHTLTLSLFGGARRRLLVIAPETPEETALALLAEPVLTPSDLTA